MCVLSNKIDPSPSPSPNFYPRHSNHEAHTVTNQIQYHVTSGKTEGEALESDVQEVKKDKSTGDSRKS